MVWGDPFDDSNEDVGAAMGEYHPDPEDEEVVRNEDLARLYFLCGQWLDDQSEDGIHEQWELVREWFAVHSHDDAHDAALLLGDSNVTALHLACKFQCPPDIIALLLKAAPTTVEVPDSHGWLPLHYAAANLAKDEVLEILVDTFPDSTSIGDNKGRTPLHFALSAKDTMLSPSRAKVLSTGDANHCTDLGGGMLPFHYACAFGVPVEVLRILLEAYSRGLRGHEKEEEERKIASQVSNDGKTPLHYACVNPSAVTAPDVVEFILDLDPNTANKIDDEQYLALRRFAIKVKDYQDETDTHPGIERILDAYLKAEPHATADFLTAVQELPEWLRDRAVITPTVQKTLNKKISRRFPTAILLLDFVLYVVILASFHKGVDCSISLRSPPNDLRDLTCEKYMMVCCWALIASAFYFFIRELIQVLSFASMGILKTWFLDETNYIDVFTIGFSLYFGIEMLSSDNKGELIIFRTLASTALIVFWATLISFLTRANIEFAVFVGGLMNVMNRLSAFLSALIIILIAFAQILVLIFFDSDKCQKCPRTLFESADGENYTNTCTLSFENNDVCYGFNENISVWSAGDQMELCGEDVDILNPNFETFDNFCTFGFSFMKLYAMLLGEVSDEDFFVSWEKGERIEKFQGYSPRQALGIFYFLLFMFLVVILLANVLIAIVTDSYGVIKNERAAIVFWSNRLDFVSEIDAIHHGPFFNMVRRMFFLSEKKRADPASSDGQDEEAFGRSLWKTLTHDISSEADDLAFCSLNFLVYSLFRISTMIFIVFLWIPFGFLSAGFLWPPQVRSYLWTQQISSTSQGEVKELEQRTIEVKALSEEVKELQDEIVLEMTADRREVVAMKAQFKNMKYDLQNEMKDIKQIVMMLFDLRASEDM